MPEQFVVCGTIIDTRQHPVRAFDKDLPSLKSDELVGDAITNVEGGYEIAFGEEGFRAHELGGPDVYIEALTKKECAMTTDGGSSQAKAGNHSQYEELIGRIAPYLGSVSAANLSGPAPLRFGTKDLGSFFLFSGRSNACKAME
jgi:hypothetical protein